MRIFLALFVLCSTAIMASPARPAYDQAVLSWAVPEGYEDSYAIGDPFLVTYEVQAAAPGPITWVTMATTDRNWYRTESLAPGLWRFRVRALVDGQPIGVASGVLTKQIPPAPAQAQPRTPAVRVLAVEVQ